MQVFSYQQREELFLLLSKMLLQSGVYFFYLADHGPAVNSLINASMHTERQQL
jgi:flagellar biosynthesis protein FlhB